MSVNFPLQEKESLRITHVHYEIKGTLKAHETFTEMCHHREDCKSHILVGHNVRWVHRKVNKVQPVIRDHISSDDLSIREEIVLSHSHICHTRLYLLVPNDGEDRPKHGTCDTHLTVEHILIVCGDLTSQTKVWWCSEYYTAFPAHQCYRSNWVFPGDKTV